MSKKKSNKLVIKQVERLVEEEAHYAEKLHNVRYTYHHYSPDVQTFYVWQELDSPQPVEHYMMESLQDKIQEINPRYRIGILFQGDHPSDLEDEDG